VLKLHRLGDRLARFWRRTDSNLDVLWLGLIIGYAEQRWEKSSGDAPAGAAAAIIFVLYLAGALFVRFHDRRAVWRRAAAGGCLETVEGVTGVVLTCVRRRGHTDTWHQDPTGARWTTGIEA
jgi:hypothetical protein